MIIHKLDNYIQILKNAEVPASDLLLHYIELLLEMNQKINLTGASNPEELALKHIADVWGAFHALGGLKHTVVDVGSGGGIPGIPLAIFSPHTKIWLVERRLKKSSALSQLVSALQIQGQIKILAKSFEEIKQFPQGAEFWFRGFLPGSKLALYLSRIDPAAKLGTLILMKGPKWIEEKIEIMCQSKVKKVWLERFMSAKEIYYELPHQSGKRVLVIV